MLVVELVLRLDSGNGWVDMPLEVDLAGFSEFDPNNEEDVKKLEAGIETLLETEFS